MYTYILPFSVNAVCVSWQVLVCVGVSLLAASLLLGLLESWTPFYPGNRLTGHRGRHTCYFRSFRLVYGALLAQGESWGCNEPLELQD